MPFMHVMYVQYKVPSNASRPSDRGTQHVKAAGISEEEVHRKGFKPGCLCKLCHFEPDTSHHMNSRSLQSFSAQAFIDFKL